MNTSRIGKCINFGNCVKADRKEIIELDVTEDFVCPECNSDLLEEAGKKKKNRDSKKILIIIVVVLLLLGGGAAAYFLLSGEKEETTIPPPFPQVEADDFPSPDPGQPEQPEPTPEPKITEPEQVKQNTQTEPKKVSTPTSGTVSVTGGTYTGEIKNGKPHGMGTLKYNTRTLISKRDSKNRYAEAGEYITGEFYEGELVLGKLFDTNGNQRETLNVGRPR